jgi:ubiquinone/menaquinone biosynthesis C-methylase UbiE
MPGTYQKNYWRVGFATKLYDWLCPEAYWQSIRTCVKVAPNKQDAVWLDIGCGSGQLIRYIADRHGSRFRYIGLDVLSAGLAVGKAKAEALADQPQTLYVQSDLTKALPLRPGSVDIAVAHFSLYTLADGKDRRKVLEQVRDILKPKGRLIVANPSLSYDVDEIIKASMELDWERHGPFVTMLKGCLVYPLAARFGLKFIKQQLTENHWHAYSLKELKQEVESAGFHVERFETVYGGSGYLVVGRVNLATPAH